MKKIMTLLFIVCLLAVGVYAGSPYYTVYQLKQAYDNQDGATLAAAIDYSQLTVHLKTQLNGKFANTLSQYPMVAQLGGDALVEAGMEFIDRSVDGAVTADNIQTLVNMQGQSNQVNQSTQELAAAWAIASNQVNLTMLIQDLIVERGDVDKVVKKQMQLMMDKQALQLTAHTQAGTDSEKPQLSYCAIDCFSMSGQIKGYPLTVRMQRQGWIDWKIVDVQLP